MTTMICPVILTVPEFVSDFTRKYRLMFIRQFARRSVRISSEKIGCEIGKLHKDNNGVPARCGNLNWSLSHKIRYVAGVVSSFPVGIDIEEILPKSKLLYDRIATSREWELSEGKDIIGFFRYWTAKEAVLKAEKVGLAGFANCSIKKIISEIRVVVSYLSNLWYVEHFYFDNHIVAVASTKVSSNFNWLLF